MWSPWFKGQRQLGPFKGEIIWIRWPLSPWLKEFHFLLMVGEGHSVFNQNIIFCLPQLNMVGCLYFLFFCKVSETILGGKAWQAPPETCINRMACLDGLCGFWKPPPVGSYSMFQWPYLWKCYFNHLEMCYPFLIILPTGFVFLGGTRGTCH